ncbi:MULTISPECIES: sensor histidine kinase [unclassified Corynebacterium]|uniref:sensor histidine kinase n=1 Tax=unclassified Corynebacterium TaxID=2624378 RepID=UPI0029CA36F8|nr:MULTISPECIES: sensor histidine kinase [unclassified Corynebacterium]WPF66114.1 sensor histidine kinase [Corynebacterium sp. 22KM0430]WPF68606.1 sensor histidine kinase [Corynebacterium sp. 21KM1197]
MSPHSGPERPAPDGRPAPDPLQPAPAHTAHDSSALDQILGAMRVGLHVLFAFLLLFGAVATLGGLGRLGGLGPATERSGAALMLALCTTLAATYLAGTLWEKRFTQRHTPRDPSPYRLPWLGLVLAQWLGLLLLSHHFLWLLFPLAFLIWHLVPTDAWGFAVVLLTWGLGVSLPLALPRAGGPLLSTAPEWGLGGVLGPFLGVAFASACYFAYRALHREAAHHRRVAEELAATQEQLLFAENQAGRLAERERLSREIHDTLAQGFNSIVLFSRACEKNLRAVGAGTGSTVAGGAGSRGGAGSGRSAAADGAQDAARLDAARLATAREQLRTIEAVATENLTEARQLVAGGAPQTRNLSRALTDLGARLTQRHGLPVEIIAPEHTTQALPVEVASALLRVAQEALTNTVRHAHATQARVTLSAWDKDLTLDIFDDGTGFDPTATQGYGLPGIRSRLREIGGTLTIDSSPHGTVVTARVPWEQS